MKRNSTLTLAQTIHLPRIQVLIDLARAVDLLPIGPNHIARADLPTRMYAINRQLQIVAMDLVHVHAVDQRHGHVAALHNRNNLQLVSIQIVVVRFGARAADPNDPVAVVRPSLVAAQKVVRHTVQGLDDHEVVHTAPIVLVQGAREVDLVNQVRQHSHVVDQFRTII